MTCKTKMIIRYEDESNPKFNFILYTDTSIMGLPRKGDLVNISKQMYIVDKVTTNINKSSAGNVIIDPIDNISYYIKLVKQEKEDKETKPVSIKNNTEDTISNMFKLIYNIGTDLSGYFEHCKNDIKCIKEGIDCIPKLEKIEELKDFISNIEFKMVSEEYEDSSGANNNEELLSIINDISSKLDKIIKPKTPVLSITRKFLVKTKCLRGSGYVQKPLKTFDVKGIKVKAPDLIRKDNVYTSQSGEINYLSDYTFNESTKTYEGIEINHIFVDTYALHEALMNTGESLSTESEDLTKYTLNDWFRFSFIHPNAVKIENELDKNSEYDNTINFINYHMRNK